MTDDRTAPLRLPRPERLVMRRFSLFDNTASPDLRFGDGVFCLAGANGLGKSTFLAALAYALTGIVAEPGRSFSSAEEYAKRTEGYHRTYFRGRIAADDAEAAEVELTMVIGPYRYRLVRGLFDSGELRELLVCDRTTGETLVDGANLDASGRHSRYAELVVAHTHLESFHQLVFLQHFVMLFDERRELLFWDETALSNALYLAFGLDPTKAQEADDLQAVVRKQDSLSRNYGWQASDVRRRLDDLRKTGDSLTQQSDSADAELMDQEHRELVDAHNEAVRRHERISGQLTDAQLDIAVRSSQLRANRTEYDALWSQRLQGHGHPSSHPLVSMTLEDLRCAVCGTASEEIGAHIREELRRHRCPLCESELAEDAAAGAQAAERRLQDLDRQIGEQQEAMAAAEQTLDALARERDDTRALVTRLATELADFEQRMRLH